MSAQPAVPPAIPPKPFKVSHWVVGAGILFGVVYLLISVLHFSGTSSGKKAEPNSSLSTAADQSEFSALNRQNLVDLQQKRILFQQELSRAGLTDEQAAEIMSHLPLCNSEERRTLNGQNYVAMNQVTHQTVSLDCESDNTWHLLPAAAADIQPPTPQQARVIQNQKAAGGHSGGGGESGVTAKERAAKALDAALNSTSVFEFVPVFKATVETADAKEVQDTKAIPAAERKAKGHGESAGPKEQYEWDSATGPLYHLFEGDYIESILTNRLAGEMTGPVNVMVTTNLYSRNHQHILLPQGTRILGEASKVSVSGQRRLAVVFHRANTPDGYSIDLAQFSGLDQQGASGLTGRVDTHWPKVIATAALIGAIGGLSEIGGGGAGYSPWTAMRLGVGEQTGQEATQILSYALNRLPTVTVYEGTRVRLWVTRDMVLPAYENHTVDPNL